MKSLKTVPLMVYLGWRRYAYQIWGSIGHEADGAVRRNLTVPLSDRHENMLALIQRSIRERFRDEEHR